MKDLDLPKIKKSVRPDITATSMERVSQRFSSKGHVCYSRATETSYRFRVSESNDKERGVCFSIEISEEAIIGMLKSIMDVKTRLIHKSKNSRKH